MYNLISKYFYGNYLISIINWTIIFCIKYNIENSKKKNLKIKMKKI